MATDKQKKAFELSLENNGNVSKAMKEAGYGDNYAKNPQSLKKSKGWQELLDEYIPEDLLQQKLVEGLNADRPAGEGMTIEDYPTRHKYLDTAFKLRGSYAAEKHDHTTGGEKLQGNNTFITPEAQELVRKYEAELKDSMINKNETE